MAKNYDFDPRNLPPELLQSIGLGIASSAQTESILEAAIAGFLGVDAEYGMALTTHIPTPLRFSILRSVAEIRIDNVRLLDELDEVLDEVKDALDKRNNFAHDSWARDLDTGQLVVVKETARTRLEVRVEPRAVDVVKTDALAIHHAGMRLMTFLGVHDFLPPLPPVRPREHKSQAARKKGRSEK